MGILRVLEHPARFIALNGRNLVGRAPYATFVLPAPHVSSEHAVIRYDGRWELLDLESRNGTFLEGGRPLPARQAMPLRVGDRICLGSPRASIELVDDAPPGPAAMDDDGGLLLAAHGMLTLPEGAEEVSVVQQDGAWQLERGDDARLVSHGDRVFLGERTLTLLLPSNPSEISHTVEADDAAVATIELITSNQGEELLQAAIIVGPTRRELSVRNHLLLLLTLAQQRLYDQTRGHDLADEGWIGVDVLCRQVPVASHLLATYVHRARRQLAEAGVPEPERIIESRGRRPSRQMRLGALRPVVRGT